MKQNKITPEVYKHILGIVKALPKFQQKGKDGKPLFRATSKLKEVKDFSEFGFTKVIERGQEPVLVNHEVNLITMYKKHGQNGINSYLRLVQETLELHKKQEPEKK